jgi:hypothetical protein
MALQFGAHSVTYSGPPQVKAHCTQFGARGFASGAAVWGRMAPNAGSGATGMLITVGFASGFSQFGREVARQRAEGMLRLHNAGNGRHSSAQLLMELNAFTQTRRPNRCSKLSGGHRTEKPQGEDTPHPGAGPTASAATQTFDGNGLVRTGPCP